jgi:hypothetical protein
MENNTFQQKQNRLISASNVIMSAYSLALALFPCLNLTPTRHRIDGKPSPKLRLDNLIVLDFLFD